MDEVLRFWFEECTPEQWWAKDAGFDDTVRRRFGALHAQAARGELHSWRGTPSGRLAEVIVLDQFSRNLYRHDPLAFAYDGMALVLAQVAIAAGDNLRLPTPQRSFLYMPYMHSESPLVHDEALRLFDALGDAENLAYERQHRAIIERFGRYPHRNALLGRTSTPEELAFLKEPSSSF